MASDESSQEVVWFANFVETRTHIYTYIQAETTELVDLSPIYEVNCPFTTQTKGFLNQDSFESAELSVRMAGAPCEFDLMATSAVCAKKCAQRGLRISA